MNPISNSLTAALQYHQVGQFAQAEWFYRQVLQQQPQQLDALHLLGVLMYQTGRLSEACDYLQQAVAQANQLAIASNPALADIYNNFGIVLRHQGQLTQAAIQLQKAMRLNPQNAMAQNNFGSVLRDQGKPALAADYFRRAIALKPDYAEAYTNLGLVLQDQGQGQAAITHFQTALTLNPAHPETLVNLARALEQQGQVEAAIGYLQQAIALKPDYAEAHNNLGNLLCDQGNLEVAMVHYQRAVTLKPDSPELQVNLGVTLMQQGKSAQAIPFFQQALKLDAQFESAYYNLGRVFQEQGQVSEAIAHLQHAIALNPTHAEAHNSLGLVLQAQDCLEEAMHHFRQALVLKPDFPEAHNNLGTVLQEQGHSEAAIACYQQALALKPDYATAYSNLGVTWRQLNRLSEAIACYSQALEYDPKDINARWNRALVWLMQGEFEQGFNEYECRWQWPEFLAAHPPLPVDKRRWDGSALAGKTILLRAEQGLGDTLQFIRYAPLLAEQGGNVVVEAQPALVNVLTRVSGVQQVVAQGDPLPDFDCYAPLLTLPRLCQTRLETLPVSIPYLVAPAHASFRIPSTSHLNVGIVWAGGEFRSLYNRTRNCPLSHFLELAEIPNLSLYSLQKGQAVAELHDIHSTASVQDLAPYLKDFADTAAIASQLDLILTVDTAVAHLAGALGRPVWVLLPFAPDWRWLLERSDSPWYPTMRLFRQSSPGDWQGVFTRLKQALKDWVQKKSRQEAQT